MKKGRKLFPIYGVWSVARENGTGDQEQKTSAHGYGGVIGDSVYTNLVLLLAGSGSR